MILVDFNIYRTAKVTDYAHPVIVTGCGSVDNPKPSDFIFTSEHNHNLFANKD